MVEQRPVKALVVGSSPTAGAGGKTKSPSSGFLFFEGANGGKLTYSRSAVHLDNFCIAMLNVSPE